MKLIHNFKSPNYNNRKTNKINFIIIHYTALESISKSLNYLCSEKNKVSCHYLISKNGDIFNLVSENKRAWHAGHSFWNGQIDINSNSIGIELDYNPIKTNIKYSKKLRSSLLNLLFVIKKKYNISKMNILAHSDIAPYRKIDPGKNFPWFDLEEKNLCFKIDKKYKTKKNLNSLNTWFSKIKLYSKRKKILFMLAYIGYDVSLAHKTNHNFNKLILIYSHHFRLYKDYYYNKCKIFTVIQIHFINILLTKLKK